MHLEGINDYPGNELDRVVDLALRNGREKHSEKNIVRVSSPFFVLQEIVSLFRS